MNFTCTLDEATGLTGLNKKKLHDDRYIMRREFGRDFLPALEAVGVPVTCNLDDCAALAIYADLRRDGYPVKVAGVIASHFRGAMRQFPRAEELTAVKLDDGTSFVRPSGDKGLAEHARAGRFPTFEMVINVSRLRQRMLRAAEMRQSDREAANAS